MKKYTYLLTIHDDETDELVGQIESLSKDSLEEQLRKISPMIGEYENRKKEESYEDIRIGEQEI